MSATVIERSALSSSAGAVDSFVSLVLGDQLCGVPVLAVRDILANPVIARIPLAPPEIAGSLNLRGRIVTAVDLRRRLGLPPAPPTLRPMSIVAEQRGELYALLVDQVAEVLSLSAAQFERNPPTLSPDWARCSAGVYRLQRRSMVVLDVERLLAIGTDV